MLLQSPQGQGLEGKDVAADGLRVLFCFVFNRILRIVFEEK